MWGHSNSKALERVSLFYWGGVLFWIVLNGVLAVVFELSGPELVILGLSSALLIALLLLGPVIRRAYPDN